MVFFRKSSSPYKYSLISGNFTEAENPVSKIEKLQQAAG